ncbi:hypothetical protein ACFY97_18435 [Streptomyces klenkii]|uniref:hypothetical protein n=1 Tax=Streptomyces klenkii TaxID=1420899 RepID=UPI0036E541C1
MATYQLEFGKVGETYPVPPLTATADTIEDLCRQVEQHAIPHLKPTLTEMGRPELADCFFRLSSDPTYGDFLWLDLVAGAGARFCAVRITTS